MLFCEWCLHVREEKRREKETEKHCSVFQQFFSMIKNIQYCELHQCIFMAFQSCAYQRKNPKWCSSFCKSFTLYTTAFLKAWKSCVCVIMYELGELVVTHKTCLLSKWTRLKPRQRKLTAQAGGRSFCCTVGWVWSLGGRGTPGSSPRFQKYLKHTTMPLCTLSLKKAHLEIKYCS